MADGAADEGTAGDGTRTGARAVDRALAILTRFRPDATDLSLTELAAATGVHVSTAHRIVRALCRGGLLDQDPRTERYHLGRLSVLLGQMALERYGLHSAQAHLDELALATGESVSLGVADGDEAVVVLRAESTEPLRFDRPPGSRIGLHASAMGKVLLAFGATDVVAAVARLHSLADYTDQTITDRAELVAELVRVRKAGFASNAEEQHAGVLALGVPVLDPGGHAHVALAVQGPTDRLAERVDELVDLLRVAAGRLSGELPLARL